MTTYDSFDAPPLDDPDAPLPGVPSPDATAIAIALNRIASALEKLSIAPGGAQTGAPPSSPGTPAGAPSAPPGGNGGKPEKTRQEKMSGKVFAICKQNGWEIGDIGQRVTGQNVGADSRTWPEPTLIAVLDAFKEWGVG